MFPLQHGHFFTADGRFGSRDAAGEQVDVGVYVLTDDDTVIVTKEFGKVVLHFDIQSDQLFLTPDPPSALETGASPLSGRCLSLTPIYLGTGRRNRRSTPSVARSA